MKTKRAIWKTALSFLLAAALLAAGIPGGKERAYFDDGRILQPVRRGKKRTMVRP